MSSSNGVELEASKPRVSVRSSREKRKWGKGLIAAGTVLAPLASFNEVLLIWLAVAVLFIGQVMMFLADRQNKGVRGKISQELDNKLSEIDGSITRNLQLLARRLGLGNKNNLWRIALYEKDGDKWQRRARFCPDKQYSDQGRVVLEESQTFLRGETWGADCNLGRTYESPVLPNPELERTKWVAWQGDQGIPPELAAKLRFPARKYFARICWVDTDSLNGCMLAIIVECTSPDVITKSMLDEMASSAWFDSLAVSLTSREKLGQLSRHYKD